MDTEFYDWLHPAVASCRWLGTIIILASFGLNFFFPNDFRRMFSSIRRNLMRDTFANVLMAGGMLAVVFTLLTSFLQHKLHEILMVAIPVFSILMPVFLLIPRLRDWISSGWRLSTLVFISWSAVGASALFAFFSYIGWLPTTSSTYLNQDTLVTMTHPFDSLFVIWESGMIYAEEVALIFAVYATSRLLKMIYSNLS